MQSFISVAYYFSFIQFYTKETKRLLNLPLAQLSTLTDILTRGAQSLSLHARAYIQYKSLAYKIMLHYDTAEEQ